MLRYDLQTDVLTRERLPGASLPLDDAAPDGTSGLEAGNPDTYLQWFLPSPDDRFLVYGLATPESYVRLYSWDRQVVAESFLAEGHYSIVRFLKGPTSVLAAADETGVAFFDLAAGRSGKRSGVFCDGGVAGGYVLANFATGADLASCGTAVLPHALSWDGVAVRDVSIVLPWDDPQAFLDIQQASVSNDGQVALEAYRRDQSDPTQHPLVRCAMESATCLESATEGRLVQTWTPTGEVRNISRDGRTLAFADHTMTTMSQLRIDADGTSREVDAGGSLGQVHACDGATEVFVLASTGPVDNSTGVRIARVGAKAGDLQTVWSSPRSTYDPASFDVSDARDRLLVVEYQMTTGTDMVRYFPRQARLVDAATGTDGGRVAGGGVPSVWSGDLRHSLVSQDRGPAGVTLMAGDPAGTMHPVASWVDPRKAVLRIASRACPSGFCPVGTCLAQAPLAVVPSVTLDGAGEAYDLAEDVTVTAVTDPAAGAPGTLEVTGPSGIHRFTVDLPPPSRLPLVPGDAVSLKASRTPGAGGAAPRQVFAAWDPNEMYTHRVVFLGGSGVLGELPDCVGQPSCPSLSFGNTGCAPDDVPGCGLVDHPPVVFSDLNNGWPFQIEPGAKGQAAGAYVTAFSTARPVDGACAALGEGTAYLLISWGTGT
jgi:hypothetical protein